MAAKQSKSYEMDLCNGPILPKMLQFSLPLMLSSVLQLLFNAADVIVVGRYAGDTALAAVGSNTALINLLCNFFIGLSVGTNILAARQFGAGDKNSLHNTVHTSILLGLVSGTVLSLIGTLCAGTFLRWMQSPDGVRDLAAVYLRIYFLGMPATMLYNFGAALLRAVGDTRRPLYYLSFAGVVNVVLNLFFVIVLKLAVVGVALATVISQCISAALVLRCMVLETGSVHLELHQLRFSSASLKQIVRTGIPAGIQGVLFSISNVAIQSSVNSFGEIMAAGNAAAINIEGFIYASMNAFHQATVSFTGQNLGAGKPQRIWPVLRRALACVIATGLLIGGFIHLLGPQLLGLYTTSPAVVSAGMIRLSIVCLTYFLGGMMDVMVGSVRGIGYAIMPMLVSLVGVCGLRLLLITTVFQIPAYHTIETVYMTYPITWSVTLCAHFICFLWGMKQIKRRYIL